jgi:hypothetical protein
MSVRRNLVIGLPESGKTTFIAAFWHVVESEEVPSALRVKQLTGDRAYLNRLREAWLRCEPVGKTLPADETVVRMLLEDRASLGTSELLLPDIAGETFHDQWINRRWTKGFDELVLAADGALVFVHPNEINEPIRIETVNAHVDGIRQTRDDGVAPPVGAQTVGEPTPTIWDAASAPTQVQLVDLLQFLIWRRAGRALNLAVVVSAWDLVRSAEQSPRDWCAARLPLLGQFLASNPKCMQAAHYGISAQGGELPKDAERLRALTHASERLEVVDDLSTSHDVTLPVQRLGAWG